MSLVGLTPDSSPSSESLFIYDESTRPEYLNDKDKTTLPRKYTQSSTQKTNDIVTLLPATSTRTHRPKRDYGPGVIDLTSDTDEAESDGIEYLEAPSNTHEDGIILDSTDRYVRSDTEEEESIEWNRVPPHLRPRVNATRNVRNTPSQPTSSRSSVSAAKNASPVSVVTLASSTSPSSPSPSSASRFPSLAPAELTSADPIEHLSPPTIEPVSAAPDVENPKTHRTHWAFVAEITPVLDQIYSGGPDHLRRSVMEDLEQDNILPAYHLREADLVLSMTWARYAHENGTNQRGYLTEYLNKYGKILLRYGAFNPVKRFLIVNAGSHRKLENPARPDLAGLTIALEIGKMWKEMYKSVQNST